MKWRTMKKTAAAIAINPMIFSCAHIPFFALQLPFEHMTDMDFLLEAE